MYEIRFKGSKAKKDFKKLLAGVSHEVKDRIKHTLENNPYPSPTHGKVLNKIEKKGLLYCYPVSGGDRILFDIISIGQNKKVVLVYYSGNDDGEKRYLKGYTK